MYGSTERVLVSKSFLRRTSCYRIYTADSIPLLRYRFCHGISRYHMGSWGACAVEMSVYVAKSRTCSAACVTRLTGVQPTHVLLNCHATSFRLRFAVMPLLENLWLTIGLKTCTYNLIRAIIISVLTKSVGFFSCKSSSEILRKCLYPKCLDNVRKVRVLTIQVSEQDVSFGFCYSQLYSC